MNEKVGPRKSDTSDKSDKGDKADYFGGSRTFQYVVRLHKPGDIDLGDFSLAYWEPQNRVYQIARAPLGTIHVRPGATPSATAEAANDPLPGLPSVRTAREKVGGERRHFDDAPAFWLGLGAMPLCYAVVVAASSTARRVREKRAAKGASPRGRSSARAVGLAAERGEAKAN